MSPVQPSKPNSATSPGAIWKTGPLVGFIFLLAAGLVSWAFLQAVFLESQTLPLPGNALVRAVVEPTIFPVFNYDEFRDGFGNLPTELDWLLQRNNAMFVFGVLGGLCAAAFALAESVCRRSLGTALVSGIACLVVGAGVGSLAGYLGIKSHLTLAMDHEMSDLIKTMRVHGLILGIMGGGIALGAGVFLGRRFITAAKSLVAGILSGVLAAIVYPISVAFLMTTVTTKVFLPVYGPERLLWLGLFTGLLGLIVPGVAADPPQKG